MAFLRKDPPPGETPADHRVRMPEGLWVKCLGCNEIIYRKEIERNLSVCPKCRYHFRLSAREWIRLLLDPESFRGFAEGLRSTDPLGFRDRKRYADRLEEAVESSGLTDALVAGEGSLEGIPLAVGVGDFNFMGGSMGSVLGEKVARVFERAQEGRRAVLLISSSGGARMQEGILSLLQMAKTAVAVARYRSVGLPYLSVLSDPTTGGVAASFASLGDVILAEPGARIGFAGPRVIQETLHQKLPEGFQRSEFLLDHGMVDTVVERRYLKATLARLLRLLMH